MNNVIKIIICVIITIIVLGLLAYAGYLIFKKEKYVTNDDGRRMDQAYITNIDAFKPGFDTQNGAVSINN